ncbi:oligoribonuclease [Trypanosoma rangeli]|uniref:Oligoribonuclease n=2 Tax=Trypanosoma rangeli TaxID=5698 RepID=A0A3R7KE78_TRYRA|nr:oligoribonuclease [Trypanosoma rangeli]RNF04753.1 oligoribonuclease [Trypanosoma rangeli]|eukprot:RNF04753.1 oligoribonuclease [Trypanosoma rangeli]
MSLVHHFFHVKGGATTAKPSTTTSNTDCAPGAAAAETVYVAVQGCCHGELDSIYAACAAHEKVSGRRIDFVVCCGDFQAVRDEADLRSMAVPQKYRVMGNFAAYYRGEKHAPYLTLFVGGNHEGSDWLATESYGGFLAPNIYYMGHSGAVVVDGRVTVAGLSGIFKGHDYARPYPGRPFHTSEMAKRSAYHVRRIEVEKLMALSRALERMRQHPAPPVTTSTAVPSAPPSRCAAAFPHVDLFLSHDWPTGITKYGDEAQLLRYKPFFADDIRHGALGNPHTMPLLCAAKPRYWLAAHLHCQFEATVPHYDVEGDAAAAGVPRATRFLALDKCSKGKGFLDFIDVHVGCGSSCSGPTTEEMQERSVSGQGRVVHHPLWLEVLRETHDMLMRNNTNWSAEACALLRLAPDELRRRGAWLPASSTAAVLEALALPPAPLQQPPVGEEGRWAPHAHDRPAEKTATAPLSAAPTAWEGDADELAVVEDVAGAP